MKGRLSPRLTAGLLTLAIWALAAGSALFWGLRLGSGPQRPDAAVAGGPPPGGVTVDTRTVARAQGGQGGQTHGYSAGRKSVRFNDNRRIMTRSLPKRP